MRFFNADIPILFIFLLFFMQSCNTYEQKDKGGNYYPVNDISVENIEFLPLSPGEVKPKGWLNDWAQKAANGITGKLDQRATTFAKGWSGKSFNARGATTEGTGWPLEQSAYWLDGLVRLAYILDNPKLKQKVKSRLDPIINEVLNGGSSFIYWRPKDDLEDNFNNWAHSHMGRAMVAYYLATGDKKILDALVKVYQEYPLPNLPADFYTVSGAVNIDPMLETYMLSKDSKIKDNLRAYAKRTNVKGTIDQWADGNLKPGHSVIYYENIRVPALLSAITGKENLLQASQSAFEWGKREHGLPLGLVSGEEYSAGIGSTRNIETCDVAAGAWTNNWLLKITGDSKYGDNLETIFFNAGPGPIDKDFEKICYYQSPNRLSTKFPEDEPAAPGDSSYVFTKIGHPVLCCVGNSNRILPNYIMHMWMKPASETGIAATLYGPSALKTTIDQTPVSIETNTEYPFEENINMVIHPETELDFTLFLRIPDWTVNTIIRVNNDKVKVKIDQNGFARIKRKWQEGDEIDIQFPMSTSLLAGKTTDYPNIDYFKNKKARRLAQASDKDFPYGSIKYGPLLFALPIPDNGPNQVKTKVPYNYALAVNPQKLNDEVKIKKRSMPTPWAWTLENNPIELVIPALQFDWNPQVLQPLPDSPIKDGKKTKIELVPYGVTKFRVSMFPVSSRTWNDP